MSRKSGNSGHGRLIWNVGTVSVDESDWRLRVAGREVDIEQKPMELLLALLHRAGEVVTKDELLDLVWPGVTVVPASLPTAIAKLRRALGEAAAIVETVPRLGYRIAGDADVQLTEASDRPLIGFAPGDHVPGASGWQLDRVLARGDADDVWLARSEAGETRVFKFAETPGRLRQLKREARAGQVLAAIGDGPARFVVPVAQAFDRVPAWLAFSDGGTDLGQWFVKYGAGIGRTGRIALVEQAVRAVGAAHALGVLHLDLKPSNLLVSMQTGSPDIRVIDFGSSVLLDHPRLRAAAVTGMTMTESPDGGAPSPAGTPFYLAPELIGDGAPSVASDIYALGLILFQLVVGDLHRPLTPGWEAAIDDQLLSDDIARACALDPADRFVSADLFADNLAALDTRRAEAERVAAEQREADRIRREAERARARRPWVIAAGAALILGTAGTTVAAWQAAHERDEAQRQTAIATAINGFLTDDLLARGDPSKSGNAGETLIDATRRAEPEIARRFGDAPLVAARLYHTLARVYVQQSDWTAARRAYAEADTAYARAGAADSKAAAIARLQHASMEALSYTQGSVERARQIIARERSRLPRDENRIDPEERVWLASARGMAELAGGDVHVSRDQFGLAARLADTMPAVFDARARNDFHQRHAFTLIRLGDGKGAEAEIRHLLAAQTRLLGPTNPDVLLLRMNLGQAYLYQRRFADAIATLSAVLPLMRQQLGQDHRLVQQTLAARVEAYGDLGDYRASIADGRTLYAIALRHQGLHAFRTIGALADMATSECRAPDIASGVADARKAYRASLEAFGAKAALTQGVATSLAQCLIEAGQDAAAAPLIAHVDRKAVAELASDPNWGANIDLAEAEIAVHAGRWTDAAGSLRAATLAYASPQADFFQHRKFEKLSALVNRAASGNVAKSRD
ncbi:protein kinase domain-containing protein [Hephaestia mangrovi]|uniref:protein kinase domain-containing protein n=1 Tax=Hephaestia mangrovi TaxID=2873268 RepID=UPI001CA62330|nr:winged helix-turn-helix domain-containing protein [Hephaestia mangrovi]MBY8828906.1 winged helix-turn-helix domain-containing protein [Hephaestia mangrovi]